MDCPRCGSFCSIADEYCDCGFKLEEEREQYMAELAEGDATGKAPARRKKKKRKKRRRRPIPVEEDDLQQHRLSVWLMLFLTWVTCGLYVPYWYMKRQPWLDSLGSSTRLGGTLPVVGLLATLSYLLLAVLPIFEGVRRSPSEFALLAEAALGIVNLVLAFKGRRILSQVSRAAGEPVASSGAATFFFQALYLQYCVNRMPPIGRARDVAHVFE